MTIIKSSKMSNKKDIEDFFYKRLKDLFYSDMPKNNLKKKSKDIHPHDVFESIDRVSAINLISFVIKNMFENDDFPLCGFFTYPTQAGGLLLEWSFNSWEISLESIPSSNTLEFHALSMLTNEDVYLDDVGDDKSLDVFYKTWDKILKPIQLKVPSRSSYVKK